MSFKYTVPGQIPNILPVDVQRLVVVDLGWIGVGQHAEELLHIGDVNVESLEFLISNLFTLNN